MTIPSNLQLIKTNIAIATCQRISVWTEVFLTLEMDKLKIIRSVIPQIEEITRENISGRKKTIKIKLKTIKIRVIKLP